MRPPSPVDQDTVERLSRMGIEQNRACSSQPDWSCYHCCIEIPYQVTVGSMCCTCMEFCDFIYCYDYFDGSGDYNLTSCRKNTYNSYCDSICNDKTLEKRILGCIVGPLWYWPVMIINCFNLMVIKNIDRCCLCTQERCCYQGECCHSKRKQLELDRQVETWKQENRRMDQEEESSQSGFSFHGFDGFVREPSQADEAEDTNSYAEHPPPDDGGIPPPYPRTVVSQV